MSNANTYAGKQTLSEEEKLRLRVAASFLRQRGQRFDSHNNFYEAVASALDGLDQTARLELLDLVNWMFEYEQAELEIYGQVSSRSRTMKKHNNTVNRNPAHEPANRRLPAQEKLTSYLEDDKLT